MLQERLGETVRVYANDCCRFKSSLSSRLLDLLCRLSDGGIERLMMFWGSFVHSV